LQIAPGVSAKRCRIGSGDRPILRDESLVHKAYPGKYLHYRFK
jgi:hypothetical protein